MNGWRLPDRDRIMRAYVRIYVLALLRIAARALPRARAYRTELRGAESAWHRVEREVEGRALR